MNSSTDSIENKAIDCIEPCNKFAIFLAVLGRSALIIFMIYVGVTQPFLEALFLIFYLSLIFCMTFFRIP